MAPRGPATGQGPATTSPIEIETEETDPMTTTTTERPAPYVIGEGTLYRISSRWAARPVPMGCYAIVRDDCGGPPISVEGGNLWRARQDAQLNCDYPES